MKIGILTHPQCANYGGILQCYALSEFLKKIGNDSIVINREPNRPHLLKRCILILLRTLRIPRYYKSRTVDRTLNMRPFVEKHLNRTRPVFSNTQIHNLCNEYGLKAIIVGSDQVWRRDFALKYGYNYFLDFVPPHVIKASYAASFGLDIWNYTNEETQELKRLIRDFSFISVREDVAVSLCKENLNIDAKLMIDPTLLLTIDDYNKITSQRLIESKYIFVYWLGDKTIIQRDIEKYQTNGYIVKSINLKDECIQESVEDWLSYIKYADFVITDSFHGVVFSILFRKVFYIYKNDSGGNSRLHSLMRQLCISQELLQSNQQLDYYSIETRIDYLREKAKCFLLNINDKYEVGFCN